MFIAATLNRHSPIPLYHQLSAQLTDAIEDGRLPKGAFLDNEIALAERWQVSRPTVRRAIQDLVDVGALVRRRGVGTQVVNDDVRRPAGLSSLHEDLVRAGRHPVTEVIGNGRVPAPAAIAADLDLPARSRVVRLVRRRSADSRRLALLTNWLPVDVADGLTTQQLERHGLYELIRERGFRPHSAWQRLGAKSASADEADMLGLSVGAALVTMRRVMQDDTGRPIEVGEHVYDAAAYSVEMSVVEN